MISVLLELIWYLGKPNYNRLGKRVPIHTKGIFNELMRTPTYTHCHRQFPKTLSKISADLPKIE